VPAGITIVGLGPGGAHLWTEAARRVFADSQEIWLRTARHPGVEELASQPGLKVHSFDVWYDEAADFASLYERIARRVIELGQREQGVVYAVPGHPSVGEATVSLIRRMAQEAGLSVRIVPGLSFLEPVLTALGIDALDGLQIADADQLAALHHPPLDPDRPALVAQLYSRRLAAQVKLTLMNSYPETHPVTLVHAAGTERERVITLPLYELDRQPGIDHLTTLYLPPLPGAASLPALQETVAHLRAPDGCPWDREQTHLSLRPYLLEEAYEVLAALDAEDHVALIEELGDLLLQIVLHVQIAAEESDFLMADVIRTIDAKLRRRHPHVFGEVTVSGVSEVLVNWEAIKQSERARAGDTASKRSILDGVPLAMPALARAQAIAERVARVGFDWPDVQGVLEKIGEEARELAAAATPETRAAELGDLLTVVVNLARWLGVDAESALRSANDRFCRRFRMLEQLAAQRGLDLNALDIHALDALWEEAKTLVDAPEVTKTPDRRESHPKDEAL
jgi:tetrapyrrole methylase family protein/MazG family protein